MTKKKAARVVTRTRSDRRPTAAKNTLTRADVMSRIHGLSIDQQRSTVCAMVGHSRIRDYCFGYHHCARCGALRGDSLAGAYRDDDAVYPSHLKVRPIPDGCNCAKNAESLTWRDTLYLPDPFPADHAKREA